MIDIAQARALYAESNSAHGFDHVLRVLALALRIGKEEGADLEVVRAAALLHDVGRAEERRTGTSHAIVGARMAEAILDGEAQDRVKAVCLTIAEHRYRDDLRPSTIESRVLYDADKLDAIGAMGVARACAMAGSRGAALWAPDVLAGAQDRDLVIGGSRADGEHTPLHEFMHKLRHLRDGMLTRTGAGLARSRHQYTEDFFRRLDDEARGLE